MKKLLIAAFAAIALLAMSACNQEPPKAPEVSYNTLEDAKGTARANALFNAQSYRTQNVFLKDHAIIPRGDSTQDYPCPQGDGWATMEFVSPDKTKVVKVKCSTVSANTGCLEDLDFKTKSFATEDGKCNARIPFPLPQIGK
jgi:hypothetical protein